MAGWACMAIIAAVWVGFVAVQVAFDRAEARRQRGE